MKNITLHGSETWRWISKLTDQIITATLTLEQRATFLTRDDHKKLVDIIRNNTAKIKGFINDKEIDI